MSTPETKNEEIARRLIEDVVPEGNWDRIDDLLADDFVLHSDAAPEPVQGPDEYREFHAERRAGVSNPDVTVEDVFAEDDKVVFRTHTTVTHDGEFIGIEPTGTEVEFRSMGIVRIEDGQIAELWRQIDLLGAMEQLGVVELPGENSAAGENAIPTREQQNKDLVERFISELVNDQDYELVEELLTAEYTRHDPDTPADDPGPEPFVESLKQLHEAFPDSEVHIDEIIAEDDLVAFEGRLTGTHEGVFRGIDPTHETIDIPGNAMHRVRDGRIAETWATWNFLEVYRQLGAIDQHRE